MKGISLKLGTTVGFMGLGFTHEQQVEFVVEAERLGYDSVWTAEAYGSDSATPLAYFAHATEKIKLGSGIMQMPGRSAAMTAMTAATIDHLSDGRMILGIGTSGPQVAEGWHGQPFGRQLERTRDYIAVLRAALARQRVEYHGSTLELPLPDGPGKALKLMMQTARESIPIYLAAIGPKNTALAAEIADGWLPTLFAPEHLDKFQPSLDEGFARRADGARKDQFAICPMVTVLIDDDIEKARDAMRDYLALYIGGMGSRKQNFYNKLVTRYGFGEVATQIQDLYLEGKKAEAAALIPAELIDTVCLCGPSEVVADRLRKYETAGVNTLIASPMTWNQQERLTQLRLLAELF
jgi:F420-dependent oxidoreductase-like protein